MTPTQRSKLHILQVMAATLVGAAASFNVSNVYSIEFSYEGRVLDADSKEPIEGAYVIAVYEKVDLGAAGSSRYCYKTKGMTTGKDGRFSFPIDKLDGASPSEAIAIKTGYYDKGSPQISRELWRKQNKETYSNRDAYLKKQDEKKLEVMISQFRHCERPDSNEAVEAGIRFLELEIAERRRLGIDFSATEYFISSMREKASRLRSAR